MTEDVMFGWHHQLDGHEFEQVVVVVGGGDERESLRYCRYMGSQRVSDD